MVKGRPESGAPGGGEIVAAFVDRYRRSTVTTRRISGCTVVHGLAQRRMPWLHWRTTTPTESGSASEADATSVHASTAAFSPCGYLCPHHCGLMSAFAGFRYCGTHGGDCIRLIVLDGDYGARSPCGFKHKCGSFDYAGAPVTHQSIVAHQVWLAFASVYYGMSILFPVAHRV